jgi:hypothetical protein
MKTLPITDELKGVAEPTVWYKPPGAAIADNLNFVAHVLTYGRPEDVAILRLYLLWTKYARRWILRRPAYSILARGPIGMRWSVASTGRQCLNGKLLPEHIIFGDVIASEEWP